jgi:hypothetical protein
MNKYQPTKTAYQVRRSPLIPIAMAARELIVKVRKMAGRKVMMKAIAMAVRTAMMVMIL